MSINKPEINVLLDETQSNPFLLCTVASKRACDINNMIRGQHLRVTAVQDVDDITIMVAGKDSITTALNEIASGTLSYDESSFDEEHYRDNEMVFND